MILHLDVNEIFPPLKKEGTTNSAGFFYGWILGNFDADVSQPPKCNTPFLNARNASAGYMFSSYIYLEPKRPLFWKVKPPKTRPFPIKTRVIWVPGIYQHLPRGSVWIQGMVYGHPLSSIQHPLEDPGIYIYIIPSLGNLDETNLPPSLPPPHEVTAEAWRIPTRFLPIRIRWERAMWVGFGVGLKVWVLYTIGGKNGWIFLSLKTKLPVFYLWIWWEFVWGRCFGLKYTCNFCKIFLFRLYKHAIFWWVQWNKSRMP